jgi:uroporphyrinogen-III synthase
LSSPLEGLRIALLETHLSQEAAAHVRRLAGIPYCVPAVRELVHPDEVALLIDRLSSGAPSVVVFMTGVGAEVLLEEAERLGRLSQTIAALRNATIACRGPKPAAALNRHDVPVRLAAAEPYTTKQLLEALASIDVDRRTVAIVHHGERNRALASTLAQRGALIEEFLVYEWAMPIDLAPLEMLVRELIDRHVDATAFTNRIQCRHLFRIAGLLGLSAALSDALNTDVIVAAIGPVCAEALQSVGVTADVIPARPTMESMIAALGDYVELTQGLTD